MAAPASLPAEMADGDKRRPSPPSEPGRLAPSSNGVPEAAEAAFLLQAGVGDMVRGALLKLLEARPEEPVEFLTSYFERLTQSSAEGRADGGAEPPKQLHWRLDRAFWYLRLAHHSHRCARGGGGGRKRRHGR